MSILKRSRLVRLLVLLLGLLVVFVMFFGRFEHSMVFRPTRPLEARAEELACPFEEVQFTTADGVKLHGWFFPAPMEGGTNAPVILYCHGNGGNISHRLAEVEALLETGAAVWIFDYRGYGLSEGRASESGTYLDAEAAYEWLLQRGFSAANIIVFGESLGGGVASELVLRKPVGGLVLQSTFTSIPDMGARMFPWLPTRLLGKIKYDTLSRLPKIHVPVVIMHSRDDTLIPFKHAERNFAAANEPKWLVKLQGDHNSSLTDRAAYIGGVRRLMDQLRSAKAQDPK